MIHSVMMAAVHGMLVMGTQSVFLSHLPMFHAPHDYQIILQAEFDPATKAAYLKSKAAFAEKVYTIAPEKFDLEHMVMHPRPFRARLYRGHFERGGVMIADQIIVRLTKVVYFKKFQPGAPRPPFWKSIVFGTPGEVFTAHEITAAPDFDQVIAGQVAPGQRNQPLRDPRTVYLELGDLAH